jgi:large subunit ribosomal protein L24
MERVKRNDTVRVVAGKDRGKEGRVVRVYPDTGKIMVEGINVMTRHTRVRMTRRGGREGGIEHTEAPFDASNVMPVCPHCDAPTRVGTKRVEGERVRYCRKCESEF